MRASLVLRSSKVLAATIFAGLLGASNSVAQEAPPETTTIQLARNPSLCIAPQYLVDEFLRAEGFTDVRYVISDAGLRQSKAIAAGEIDLTLHFSAPLLIPIDAGEKITIVAGVHAARRTGALAT